MFKKTLLAGMTTAALLSAGTASAIGAVGSFDLNFESAADILGATYTTTPGAYRNLANINDINQMSYFGHSVISFDQNPFAPSPTGKVGFDDYIVLRFDQFQKGSVNRLDDDTGYGKTNDGHQLTFITHVRGTFNQLTGKIEMAGGSVKSADFIFDVDGGGSAGNGNVMNTYSKADFTKLETLQNGLVVEVGGDPITGVGDLTQSGLNPNDPVISTSLIFNMMLTDVLGGLTGANGPFEFIDGLGANDFIFGSGGDENDLDILDPAVLNNGAGNFIDFEGFETVFGSNTYYNGPKLNSHTIKNGSGISKFVYEDSDTGRFFMVAQNKGKFEKNIVPEPASAALALLGLAGIARVTRRRK